MRAIVIGGTGAVGGALVRELAASTAWDGVTVIVRRPAAFDERVNVAVVDYANLERETARLAASYDAAFCTMGIGQPRKVSLDEFRRVDVEYVGAFARGAAKAGVKHCTLLSAIGTAPNSRITYARVKAESEQAVIDAGFERVSLFRPSVLVTKEIRYGLQDRVTQLFFPMIAPLLPRRYHQIRVEDLARAMRLNAERGGMRGVEVLDYGEFSALLAT